MPASDFRFPTAPNRSEPFRTPHPHLSGGIDRPDSLPPAMTRLTVKGRWRTPAAFRNPSPIHRPFQRAAIVMKAMPGGGRAVAVSTSSNVGTNLRICSQGTTRYRGVWARIASHALVIDECALTGGSIVAI